MTKNITVLDDSGNVIGQTWPKRAKGLVKRGRARYKDEHTLCLVACPPDDYISEEHNMNNNINVSLDPETGEINDLSVKEKEDASQIETVEVKLLRYGNGMENWQGEVQILLCPQYENGRNVVPLYSKDVEFTLTILDCYDKEKTIKLKPSTIFAQGVARGLSIIRFTPCVAKDENQWIPERNASYWITFKAIGTDGKLYVSGNEKEIKLTALPILHGRLISNGNTVSPLQGGYQPSVGGNADLERKIEELQDQVEDLEGQIVDFECQIEDLEEQVAELTKQYKAILDHFENNDVKQ